MAPSFVDVLKNHQDNDLNHLDLKFNSNGDPVEQFEWVIYHEDVKGDNFEHSTIGQQSWFPDYKWKLVFYLDDAIDFTLTNAHSDYWEDDEQRSDARGLGIKVDLIFTIFGDRKEQIDKLVHRDLTVKKGYRPLTANHQYDDDYLYIDLAEYFASQRWPLTVKLEITYKEFFFDSKNSCHNFKSAIGRQILIDSPDQPPDLFVRFTDGKRLGLHKLMLSAKWPQLKCLNQPDLIKNKTNELKIENFSYVAIKAMFIYIYTGCLPHLPIHLALELQQAADYYGMNELVKFIQQRFVLYQEEHLEPYSQDELLPIFERACWLKSEAIASLVEKHTTPKLNYTVISEWWKLALKLKRKNLKHSIANVIRKMIKDRKIKKIKDLPGFGTGDAAMINPILNLANTLCKLNESVEQTRSNQL